MPTGDAMHYVSGSGTDHVDLPRGDDVGYRKAHAQREPRPTGLDWSAHTPTCKGCGAQSGSVNSTTGTCGICAPPVASKPPKEEKQGKPTTRRSAPRATSASSTTGRAPVAGPSTTQKRKDPAAAQETRPAAVAGPSNEIDRLTRIRQGAAAAGQAMGDRPYGASQVTDLELGRELGRAARLLTDSHRHPSPAVQAIRGRVLGVLDALEAFLTATHDRPGTAPQTSSQPAERPTAVTPTATTGAARSDTPRAAGSPRRRTTRGKQVDEQAIVREYVEDRDSTPVIAARHDIWPARVRKILDAHQVERRDDRSGRSGGRNAKTIDDYPAALVEQVRRLYVDQQQTTTQVADAVGHTPKFVATVLRRAGIPRRPAANVAGRKGRDQKLDDTQRDEICRRYAAGESSIVLATAFGVSSPTVLSTLRGRGIPIRSAAAARLNHLAQPAVPGDPTW